MRIKNTLTSYGLVARCLHWFVALLVITMLVFGYFLEDVPKEYQGFTYNLHKLTGLTILALMILRVLWVLINPKPALPFGTKAWQRFAELLVQIALYVSLIAMPLAGWIGSVAASRPPHLGNFDFNLPISPNKILKEAAFDVHGTLALVIIGLVSIHILAALYHHYVLKDSILRRMLVG
jgi:cytochrome b561